MQLAQNLRSQFFFRPAELFCLIYEHYFQIVVNIIFSIDTVVMMQ